MSARRMTVVLGTAAGAFLAAGLTSLATLPVAQADDGADIFLASNSESAAALALADPAGIVFPTPETGFIFTTDPLFQLLGVTDVEAANPSEDFAAMVLTIPSLGITDVLTSGTESVNDLAQFGVSDALGLGMDDMTINTLIAPMNPILEQLFTFTIPFEDPIADLWYFLVANDFFGL